jgi:glycosyltransferase involved in cell wall biosynthesis
LREITKPHITVVIPTLNEEKGIGPTLEEIREALKDDVVGGNGIDATYLVVDGESIDRTVDIAKRKGAEVIVQQSVRGKGAAISEALRHINSDTQYILFIDGDFTYPAEYIQPMLRILENNHKVGMVTGNRFKHFLNLNRAMHNVNYVGNRFLAFTHYLANGAKLKDPLTGLRIIRWDILKGWRPISKGFDIEVELNHYISQKGYIIVEIPIKYRKRLGEKKLKWRHGLTILKRVLFQSLSS